MTLTLLGCVGGADLGQERVVAAPDATVDARDDTEVDAAPSPSHVSDAGLSAHISLIETPTTCGGCFRLSAAGTDPQVSYTFSWDDGSTSDSRRVCPTSDSPPYSVTLRDPSTMASASATFDLSALPNLCSADAGVGAPVIPLCLYNGSFEQAQSGIGPLLSSNLGAAPWQVCGTAPNFPQLVDVNMAALFMLPQPTEGKSYLSLSNGNQVSEALCAPITAGTSFGFRLDLAHGRAAAQNDSSEAVLELWGGPVAACAPAELLWSSPAPLTSSWQPFCATVRPQQALTTITLRANSSGSLPSPYEILVDHLRAVASCSP